MAGKALFFDIDGTLLDDTSRRIPESACRAIREARLAGHRVFINSGRARCLMQEPEAQLEPDGYLCGCGTYIELSGQVIFHHELTDARRREIQRGIISCRLDGILEGMSGCYVQKSASHMGEVERVKEMVEESGCLYAMDWERETAPFDKFCVLADADSETERFLQLLKPDILPIDRGHGLYECVPAGFDKATAMKFVLEYYKIPWEESYAFGDSTNDLAMIRYACHSVIMAKHDRELEPYAELITKGVREDGIAYAFEKLGIL